MNPRFALFLSVLLHPLLLPIYIFAIFFGLAPEVVGVNALSMSARGSLLVLLFLNTFVVPALIIYCLYRLGFAQSIQLETLRDRRLPYLVTVVIYAFSTYLFGWRFAPISELAPQIAVILGSIALSLALVALVSLRWKISAHATGAGGYLGAMGGAMLRFGGSALFVPLLLGVVVTGLLLSARLRLDAHTPAQVGAGLGLGMIVSIIAVFMFF